MELLITSIGAAKETLKRKFWQPKEKNLDNKNVNFKDFTCMYVPRNFDTETCFKDRRFSTGYSCKSVRTGPKNGTF
jgi:hypothetical protein